ncbi:transposase [Sinorhizobium meliloti]|nr:transposase [Sinorhizobium meliloti]MDX0328336.1 transposase [Sinorhizobium meliloti]
MIEAVADRLEGAPRQLRRRWSDEFKARAVAEALEPGASVSAIAHRIGIHPSQLFAWRRNARTDASRSVRLAQGPRCARLPRWSRLSLVTLSCAPAQTSPRRSAMRSRVVPCSSAS